MRQRRRAARRSVPSGQRRPDEAGRTTTNWPRSLRRGSLDASGRQADRNRAGARSAGQCLADHRQASVTLARLGRDRAASRLSGEGPMKRSAALTIAVAGLLLSSAAPAPKAAPAYDLLIRGGTIYDGSGGAPFVGDVAIKGDRIVYVGPKAPGRRRAHDRRHRQGRLAGLHQHAELGDREPDRGRPRARATRVQGVTLEVIGEGKSMGPLERGDEARSSSSARATSNIRHPLDHARRVSRASGEASGVTPNVASFVGATTVRIHELGEGDVDPTPEQLAAHARAGPRGDEGRRDRRRLVADLRARPIMPRRPS